jgi:WD40 repeat protein
LATAGDRKIKIWRLCTKLSGDCYIRGTIRTLLGHSDSIISMVQLSDGCLESVSSDKTIRKWKKNDNDEDYTGTDCKTLTMPLEDYIFSVVKLENGNFASVSRTSTSGDNSIKIWY